MIRLLLVSNFILRAASFKFENCYTDSNCFSVSEEWSMLSEPSDWTQCNAATSTYDVKFECGTTDLLMKLYNTPSSSCSVSNLYGQFEFVPAEATKLFSGQVASAYNTIVSGSDYVRFDTTPTSPQPVCSSGVGGDPIITYNGIEKKFTLPKIGMTTLLSTSEIVIQASPISGEKEDEQWIGQVLVSTTAGLVVANIRIRNDLESFVAKPESDDFETITVKASWHDEHWLKLPNRTLVPYGKALLLRPDNFAPTSTVQFRLGRFRTRMEMGLTPIKTTADTSRFTPHNEVVFFETDEVVFSVSSVPAMEYYWEDSDDYRSLKFSHLDVDFIHIKQANSCQGLLPTLWKGAPENTSQVSVHGDLQSVAAHHLRKQILEALV